MVTLTDRVYASLKIDWAMSLTPAIIQNACKAKIAPVRNSV